MILKPLDNHEDDINTLNSCLDNKSIPETIKKNIRSEIIRIKAGIKAQKEAEYCLDYNYGKSENHFIIHDLRLDIDGRVAQIDHLIFNRLLEVAVCESKNFSEGVSYNEQLEFNAFYQGKPYGITSPIQQNNRHIKLLQYIFDNNIVQSPTRLGFKMDMNFWNFILTSNNAIIQRSEIKLPNLTFVSKNDQFDSIWSDVSRASLGMIRKLSSAETIDKLARDILALHKPIKFNWIDKFGISQYLKEDASIKPKGKAYHCEVCKEELDNSVLFWCRKNKEKFNGKLLCREHQK
jgi:hypothetical protein